MVADDGVLLRIDIECLYVSRSTCLVLLHCTGVVAAQAEMRRGEAYSGRSHWRILLPVENWGRQGAVFVRKRQGESDTIPYHAIPYHTGLH